MRRVGLVAALGLLALTWAQFAFVSPTNFGGTDEWLYISLTSRGIVDSPYSNRPWMLVWTLPGALGLPHTLWGYFLVHVTYIWLAGCTCFALVRRLAPARYGVAAMAGAFTIAWAPLDWVRLNAVGLVGYAGFTFFALLTVLLLLEAYRRGSLALFGLAAVLGFINVRGFEGTLPLLAAAPFLLVRPGEDRRRLAGWALAWECALAVPAWFVVRPLLFPSTEVLYQTQALGLDPIPSHVFVRVLALMRFHLDPLLGTPLRELQVPAVPLAVGAFLVTLLATRASDSSWGGGSSRRGSAALLGLGLAAATAAYLPFALSPTLVTPVRTQFLSGPGIGLGLASLLSLGAGLVPAAWRRPLAALLGSWIVAVGTGRIVAMQADWKSRNLYPAQRASLVSLMRVAPRLKPHTLVLLADRPGPWVATFTFRHAVSYLYGGSAVGHVWLGHAMLYPARFEPAGLRVTPWHSVQGPWNEPPTTYGYDEILAVALGAGWELRVLDRWPEGLPPLPAGSSYDPLSRILTGVRAPAELGGL
jgi:hypothetical protein